MCCHTHEITDVAAAVVQDTARGEQNRDLLEALVTCEKALALPTTQTGSYAIVATPRLLREALEQARAAIEKAESRS